MKTATAEPRTPPFRPDPAALASLRDVLLRAGFTEQAVSARTGVPTIYDFVTLREGRDDDGEVRDELDALIRLFIDGEPVARAATPPALLPSAQRLGLVRAHPVDSQLVIATVLLYPTEGLYIVSDLEHDPLAARSAQHELASDAVYPAITRSTQTYLSLHSDAPADRFLELCGGTGIAALLAARRGADAVATDITERSVEFARFNAALNDLGNMRAACGDLYDAVAGETFDRIVAHPPYMPALGNELIYRDGGEDGEQVTQRVLAGLATHLRPGGRFDCTGILTDRVDGPVEARVRTMLGERADEFDVLVVVTQTKNPVEAYARLVREERSTFADARRQVELFRALRTERIVGCSLVIVRHDSKRPAVTVRRSRTPQTDAAAVDWMLAWMRASTDPRLSERLLDSRPRLSPRTRLDVNYAAGDDGWRPGSCGIRVDAPFGMAVNVSLEIASFMAACDGSATVREHIARMLREGTLDADPDLNAFGNMVRSLAIGGFLLVDPATVGG